ncbi:MAG TPA: hypothetical protein VFI47_20425 [Acidimicrobiales bacterium]|nr:hypothetical protein [Acidimicrobiales bacterium]
MVRGVDVSVGDLAPGRAARDRHLAANVSVQIFGGVLPSIVAASRADRLRLTRELTSALVGYWAGVIVSPGGGRT